MWLKIKMQKEIDEKELVEDLLMMEDSEIDESVRDEEVPELSALCIFLAEYGSVLLGCGSTCIRLENNVKRMAEAFGMEATVYTMPRHIHVSVWVPGHEETATAMESISKIGISFDINTRLSQLSWELADRQITFAEAKTRFREIVQGSPQNPWLLILLVAVANASFCRLFGGDVSAMALVAAATGIGYFSKQQLLKRKIDIRVTVIICAFISALVCSLGVVYHWGDVPSVAVATSVLYLVPGIPFINSFSDLLYRHYICAFARFLDAMVLTLCLSIGLVAGMMLMHIPMF